MYLYLCYDRAFFPLCCLDPEALNIMDMAARKVTGASQVIFKVRLKNGLYCE